jgi:hypothetical protein|nr:MAG TPA: hypothetical protein [Caudoviricetes sp.]
MQVIKLNDDIYSDFIIYTASEWKKEALYNANCEKLYNLTDTINIVFI